MRIQLPILIILFVLSSQLSSSQGRMLRQVNFLPSWEPQAQFAGYYMAKEKNIYEKYGMDVNIINGGFDKNVAAYLKQGKVDFGIMPLSSAIIEREDSTALINIGQIFQCNEIMFVAKKKSGIKEIKDFAGKKIAVWRTALEELTDGFLDEHNIKAHVIKINEGVNIFLKNAVDVCEVMYYNEYNNLINFGVDPDELNVFYLKDYGMNFPEDGIYCMENTFNHDQGLCAKFVQASIDGWKYALSHQEETLQVLKKYQKEVDVIDNKTHSEWMLRAMGDVIKPSGKKVKMGDLLEDDYNKTIQFLLRNKQINTSTKYNIFYRGTIKNE
jgi:NitT/TauT family transport system substrate-binding protein